MTNERAGKICLCTAPCPNLTLYQPVDGDRRLLRKRPLSPNKLHGITYQKTTIFCKVTAITNARSHKIHVYEDAHRYALTNSCVNEYCHTGGCLHLNQILKTLKNWMDITYSPLCFVCSNTVITNNA